MWGHLLDVDFQRRIHLEGLGFQKYELESQDERGDVMHRVAQVIPRVDMPKALTKVLGDSIGYKEFVTFDRVKKDWKWHLKMSGPGAKIHVGGTIELLPGRNESGCIRRTHFEVECKIFGVGGLIEKTVKTETLANYEKAAVFINANT